MIWKLNLNRVEARMQGDTVLFIDSAGGNYPIPAAALSNVLRKTLVECTNNPRMGWSPMHKLLTAAPNLETQDGVRDAQVVEVYQLERWHLSRFGAPFLPGESNEKNVWMDTTMYAHPKLDLEMTLTERQKASTPPIEMGALWTPTGPWEIVTENADELGYILFFVNLSRSTGSSG